MKAWLMAILLAGCSSDGRHYAPPPADATASCAVTVKQLGHVGHEELWFDSAGRPIQADGYGGSMIYAYDDQGRLASLKTADGSTVTWAYEPTQITEANSDGYTFIYNLCSDGRVTRWEGPEEVAAAERDVADYQYDAAGHITSVMGMGRYSDAPNGPVMIESFDDRYTYDAQGRLASAQQVDPQLEHGATTYTYTETPGHLVIQLASDIFQTRTYSYDFDASNRIIRAALDDGGMPAASSVTYSYVDDRITAITDDRSYEVDTSGVCPGVSTAFGPRDPLVRNAATNVATLPNPAVDDFNEGIY